MGVYINMEIPKCCAECDAEGHYENSYGDEYGFFCPFGYKEYTDETRDAKRLDNCPLVPVPPHGDLIDRDALIKDGWLNLHKEVMRMGGYAIHELPLKNPSIPVIIPAEEAK